MANEQKASAPLSSCCKKAICVSSPDEGRTYCYVCTKCNEPCDLSYDPVGEGSPSMPVQDGEPTSPANQAPDTKCLCTTPNWRECDCDFAKESRKDESPDTLPRGKEEEVLARVLNNLGIVSAQVPCLWQKEKNIECPHCRIISYMHILATFSIFVESLIAERDVYRDDAVRMKEALQLCEQLLPQFRQWDESPLKEVKKPSPPSALPSLQQNDVHRIPPRKRA